MFRQTAGGLVIEVHAQPNASKNQIVGEHGGRLKIKLQSPPVEGKANECLVEFISCILSISKSKIHIIKGETSRQKSVLISEAMSLDEVKNKLGVKS